MQVSGTETIIDYTIVPVGLRIEGLISTGQATTFTALCPQCGRNGVVSTKHNNKRIMVHQGRASGNMLQSTDHCEVRD